jgi:hypothetical protein
MVTRAREVIRIQIIKIVKIPTIQIRKVIIIVTRVVTMVERVRMVKRSLIREIFSATIAKNMATLLMNADPRMTLMMLKQKWLGMMMMRDLFC